MCGRAAQLFIVYTIVQDLQRRAWTSSRCGLLTRADSCLCATQAPNADLANRLYGSAEVAGSARFAKPKLSRTGFELLHYAGPVAYKTDNFLAKNRDFVVAEHQALLQASGQGFVRALFPAEPEANGNAVRARCLSPHGTLWVVQDTPACS